MSWRILRCCRQYKGFIGNGPLLSLITICIVIIRRFDKRSSCIVIGRRVYHRYTKIHIKPESEPMKWCCNSKASIRILLENYIPRISKLVAEEKYWVFHSYANSTIKLNRSKIVLVMKMIFTWIWNNQEWGKRHFGEWETTGAVDRHAQRHVYIESTQNILPKWMKRGKMDLTSHHWFKLESRGNRL